MAKHLVRLWEHNDVAVARLTTLTQVRPPQLFCITMHCTVLHCAALMRACKGVERMQLAFADLLCASAVYLSCG